MADLKSAWDGSISRHVLPRTKERKARFHTDSGIPVERLYTPLDLEKRGFSYETHLGFPGQYPFTRGKNPLGYRETFWIFQQYAGFGDADQANERYRFLLDRGQTGISIALDLPTQIGLDSDNPLSEGEVGKVGVAIDSLEDLELIFKGIPLNQPRQISLVANATALIGLAMFIALAEKQKISPNDMVLRIQNDILKEFIARGTYIYPPGPSVRLATDLVTYCTENHPKWLPLTVCGYHIREAGSNAGHEIAFSIANGLEYMDHVRRKGFDLHSILPKLSVFLSVNMNFFEEIAKFRAYRRLWARLVKERYNIQDCSKIRFDLINFTAGSTLTAQQPINNVVRVTIECLAGVLGGCQSLFPCSMDEAYCTPTENAVKVALRTQQIIAHETGVADTIDPLGGSYYVEALTFELENEAKKHLEKIDKIGGAMRAVEIGFFQEEIRKSAYKYQRDLENKQRIVVGLNEYIEEQEMPIKIFRPSKDTEEKQKRRLRKLRERRNNKRVKDILNEVAEVAQTEENLVPVVVEAVKSYATLGEISDVFRKVFGEHREIGL